ncbi:MAG: hypothetical protein KUL86_10305 [Castellaniella sp.]|nr:hypothetical protein [Castellaniella sp.]
MAALPIPAHFAHTFPQTEKAARRAARQWFAGATRLSLACWRDDRRSAHCSGLPAVHGRMDAFNQAFAQELAAIIAGGCTGSIPTDAAVAAGEVLNASGADVSGTHGRFAWEDGSEQRGYLIIFKGGRHE